jgi:hypothetical protein
VHGTEGALAFILPPGSVFIEIDHGATNHNAFYYKDMALSARIKYLYFGGVYPSIEECSDWMVMYWANGCGIYVDLKKLKELLDSITPYIANHTVMRSR